MHTIQMNYIKATHLSTAAFHSIPDEDSREADNAWDAYDEARDLEREAGKQLVAWGEGKVSGMPMTAEDKANVARMFEIARTSEHGDTFRKLCDLLLKLPA